MEREKTLPQITETPAYDALYGTPRPLLEPVVTDQVYDLDKASQKIVGMVQTKNLARKLKPIKHKKPFRI